MTQAITVVALFLTAGHLAGRAESEHQQDLLEAMTQEEAERIRSHLVAVESIAELVSELAAEPGIESDDLTSGFRAAMQASTQIDGIFIGRPDGRFHYLNQDDDGFRLKEIAEDSSPTVYTWMNSDGELLRREFVREVGDERYDPTSRPWYAAAISSSGDLVWTDPYVFFSSGELGVTVAKTIERDGSLMGVVGVDIALGQLSRFLSGVDVGVEGGTVIVNGSGVVVAHPDPALIQVAGEDGPRTVGVSELADVEARTAVAALVAADSFSGGMTLDYTSEALGPSRAAFRSVAVGADSWTVAVYGPDEQFVASLADARNAERLLILVAGTLSLVVIVLVAVPATRHLGDLESRARLDSLTGLPNRRSILETAEIAAESGGTDALAILDVDHFKAVNDTHGHQAGDAVLASVARRVERELRSQDSLGRIGGEEFLIVLRDVDVDTAWRILERVRDAVNGRPVEVEGMSIPCSISVGFAIAVPGADRDTVLGSADDALREAKDNGRDQVSMHQRSKVQV